MELFYALYLLQQRYGNGLIEPLAFLRGQLQRGPTGYAYEADYEEAIRTLVRELVRAAEDRGWLTDE